MNRKRWIGAAFALAAFSYARADKPSDADCPAQPVKLSRPNPPVLDQGESPWCVSFATATLLNYHLRKNNAALPADFCVSPTDINARIGAAVPERLKLTAGANPSSALNDLQANPKPLKTDKGLPFLFPHGGGLNQFVAQHSETAKEFFGAHPDRNAVELENVKGKLGEIPVDGSIHATNGETGVDLELPVSALDLRKVKGPTRTESYPSEVKLPAFEIHHSQFNTRGGNDALAFQREVLRQLKLDRPLAVSTCQNPLEKELLDAKMAGEGVNATVLLAMEEKLRADPCGAHMLTIVGMKRDAQGKCVAVLQNSWGKNWNRGGLVELRFDQLLRLQENSPPPGEEKSISLTWIENAKTGQEAQNELRYAGGGTYRGTTRFGSAHGVGTSTFPDGGSVTGTYSAGSLVEGQAQGFIFSSGSKYTGAIHSKDRRTAAHGKGRLENPDGSVQEGTFSEARLVDGKITESDGSVSEGHWEAGRLTKGSVTRADGTVRKGDFKDGRLQKGSLRGTDGSLSDGTWAEGFLVEGTITREDRVTTGRFQDGRITDGEITFADGRRFNGKWIDGVFRDGTQTDAEGTVYAGTWDKDGNREQGRRTDRDGSFFDGMWKDNAFWNGSTTGIQLKLGGMPGKFTGQVKDGVFAKGIFTGDDRSVWQAQGDGTFVRVGTQPAAN